VLPHLSFPLCWQRLLKGLSRRATQQLGSRKGSSQHSPTMLIEGLSPDGRLMQDAQASAMTPTHGSLVGTNVMKRTCHTCTSECVR
jgi:hypothetical protein